MLYAVVEEICIELYHGGKFVDEPALHYKGGTIEYYYNIIPSQVSFSKVVDMVKDLPSVCVDDIFKLYYCVSGLSLMKGLRTLKGEGECRQMIRDIKLHNFVELYVQKEDEVDEEEESDSEAEEFEEEEEGDVEKEDELSIAGSLDNMSDNDEEIIQVRTKHLKLRNREIEVPVVVDLGIIQEQQGRNPTQNLSVTNLNDDVLSDCHSFNPLDSPKRIDANGDDEVDQHQSFPIWDPLSDPFSCVFIDGLRFPSPEKLKEVLTCVAVKNGYGIWFEKTTKKILHAKCGEKCTFRLWATWMTTEHSFQIKSLIKEHSCHRVNVINIVHSDWLAKYFKDDIMKNTRWKLREFVKEVKERYNIEVTQTKCRRAKNMVLSDIYCEMKKHYAGLWDYCAELRRTNTGGTFKIQCERLNPLEPPLFKRFYVGFEALSRGWREGCRPIIGIDGCFLKGTIKGELLAAVGRDANNQLFPIAWAVVEVECYDSWCWFLKFLLRDICCCEDGLGLTICSDQQKGLIGAVADLLPKAEHRNCARHIYENFYKNYTGGVNLKLNFWIAARAGTEAEFKIPMEDIKVATPAGYHYLTVTHNPKYWARAFFQTFCVCEAVENNMSECFNAAIIEARFKPIIDMLEDIRLYVMDRMMKNRRIAARWEDPLCPQIRLKLENSKENQRFWTTHPCGEGLFEVKHGRDSFTVNLDRRKCACRMWELSGIPCRHACSAIYYERKQPEDFVSDWLKKEMHNKAYAYYMKPINGRLLWPESGEEPLLPPFPRKMPGRPKTKRRKSASEQSKKTISEQSKKSGESSVISRIGEVKRCSICNDPNHNKRSCPDKEQQAQSSHGTTSEQTAPKKLGRPRKQPVVSPVVEGPKRKRGRPRKEPTEKVPRGGKQYFNAQGNKNGHVAVDIMVPGSSQPTTQPSSQPTVSHNAPNQSSASVKEPAIKQSLPSSKQVSKTLGVRMGVKTRAWMKK